VPACGYSLVETITWTIPTGTPISENGANRYLLDILSTDGLSHHATVPVIVKNVVQYDTQVWEP